MPTKLFSNHGMAIAPRNYRSFKVVSKFHYKKNEACKSTDKECLDDYLKGRIGFQLLLMTLAACVFLQLLFAVCYK